MRKLIFNLFIVIVSWVFVFLFVFPWNAYDIELPIKTNDYKLGLDLQWWIELDYKIDLTEAKKEEGYNTVREKSIIEWLKSIIDKRVESLNINDSIITWANYAWEQHIIVQIPLKWNSSLENNENIERAKEAIWKVVKIEFKEARDKISDEDLIARKKIAEDFLDELKSSEYSFSVVSWRYNDSYENVAIWTTKSLEADFIFSTWWLDLVSKDWITDSLIEVRNQKFEEWYLVLSVKDKIYNYLFLNKQPSNWIKAQDTKWRFLNDKYFIRSSVQYNEAFQPMIELTFNDEGAEIFWELTKRLIWQPIAIFVWWQLLTAPNVNDAILSWKAVITGQYTPAEANKLSQDINTWVVPAPIYLTSERTIDSRLWANSLSKLIVAWVSWFLLILVFLLYTYRLSGLIASIALLIYVVLVLTIIKSFWVVLTLASIAWLILSIGMAIDANILIFERIKGELKKWNNMEKSVRVWFTKSWSAIWDSNVTGLIISLILFIFWVNMIKWFGLMLAIWIVVSLFSVMFISRIFIKILWNTWVKNNCFIWLKK